MYMRPEDSDMRSEDADMRSEHLLEGLEHPLEAPEHPLPQGDPPSSFLKNVSQFCPKWYSSPDPGLHRLARLCRLSGVINYGSGP